MDPATRWREVERMARMPAARELELIRTLLREQIAENRADDDIGCGDTLYGLCNLLFLVGTAEDVGLIHEARCLNIDTGCMIDRDLLTMHRDFDTMRSTVSKLVGAPPALASEVAAAFAPEARTPQQVEASMRFYLGVDISAPE